jgi:hypothetical protein
LDLEWATLEMVIHVCPIGQPVSIMVESPLIQDELERECQGQLNEEEGEQ